LGLEPSAECSELAMRALAMRALAMRALSMGALSMRALEWWLAALRLGS